MFGLLGGLLLKLPGIAEGVLGYLNKKTDSALEQHKANVGADRDVHLELVKVQLEAQRSAGGNKMLVALAAMFVIPYGLHNAAIVLDSTFRFEWAVDALPGKFADIEHQAILAVIGVVCGPVFLQGLKKVFTR